jgi:hypothetical protein
MKRFTRSVTPKFTETDFQRLQASADREGKRLDEWCRDKLLEMVNGKEHSACDQALLAEIAATQSITVSLLFAFARDGKLPEQKVREILDRVQKKKYAEASDLLRQAEAWRQNGNSSADTDELPTRLRR